jgi:hypothetical protein
MKYTLSILLATSFILSIAQNPLKTALKGNTQSAFYNKTQYQMSSDKREPLYVADLVDNRPNNWNKQINDSIKVELIRDFWTFPYKHNFREKINQDFQNFKYTLLPTKAGANYVLSPSVEVHYPNFIYDPKGYRIYTRINMKLVKDNNTVLEKAYDDFYFFTKGETDWQDNYTTDYLEGTNYAMWIGMRRALDKFYIDFDAILDGREVAPGTLPLKVDAIASNIAKDESLNKQQKPYSTVKEDDKYKPAKTESTTTEYANNTVKVEPKVATPAAPAVAVQKPVEEKPKEEFKKPEPPVANNKELDNAMSVLGVKPAANPPLDAKTEADRKASMELAIKKSKEGDKKKIMDSIQSIKEKEAQIAKEKAEKEKNQTASLTKVQKDKLDSIKNANLLALKEKENKKRVEDSIKKAEVNKTMELAKLEKEKAKAKLSQNTKPATSNNKTNNEDLAALDRKIKEKEAIKAELAKEAQLAKERREKEAQTSKEKANKEILMAKENEAKAQKEKLANEAKLAKEKAEKEAKLVKDAQLAKEKKEKEEKLAKEKAEKELLLAKEKEAKAQKEKLEKEAKLAKEKAEKEMLLAKEKEAKTQKEIAAKINTPAKADTTAIAMPKDELPALTIQKPSIETPSVEREIAKVKNSARNMDPLARINKSTPAVSKIEVEKTPAKTEEKPATTPEVKEVKKEEVAKVKANEAAKTQVAKVDIPVKVEPIKGKETVQLPKPKLDKEYTREDYLKDSLFYAFEKERKREAILAAQKAAFESEKNSVNIINGQVVSNDPPSKLPDNRTPEERAKDRIFTPQSDASKELLARVVLITKDDEKTFEKILENYDPISRKEFLDSIAIARQMSKPKNEKKSIIEDITVPKTSNEDLPKVNEVPKSTNLINKTAANIKSTASNVVNNAKTSAPTTMVKEIGVKATEDAKTAILNKKMEEDLKAKANAILPQKTATTTAPSTTAPAKTSTPAVSTPVKSIAPATTAPAKVAPATTTPTTPTSTPSPSATTTAKPSMTIETPSATSPEPKKRSARLVIED